MTHFHARGFGLNWRADVPLVQFDPLATSVANPDICVAQVERLSERAGATAINRGEVYVDGFRLGWGDEVTFDMFGGTRIDYCTGPDWRGTLPPMFFGTVTGLTLAWRGLLPLHATALELSGQAFLLTGSAGTGKSTLAAELMAHGAQLISDDLTILEMSSGNAAPLAFRGRQTMRLHPDTAARTGALRREDVPDDPRGKLLVWPTARTSAVALPVGGLILLGKREGSLSGIELAPILPELLYRPAWLAAMPAQVSIHSRTLELARSVPAWVTKPVAGFAADDRARRAERILAAIANLTA